MHEIYELKEMLCEELEKYGAKEDLKAGELEIVDKLAHTVKNLGKIIEMYEDEGGEYSGRYNGGMSYQRGGRGGQGGGSNRSYARGNGRGRGSNARRDSMGRYSSERGYSRAVEDMADQLRDLMEESPNEAVRRDIERLVKKIDQM